MTYGDEPITAITNDHDGSPCTIEFEGLTKREYFAAMAMQGLISSTLPVPDISAASYSNIPTIAVASADALIHALNKQEAE